MRAVTFFVAASLVAEGVGTVEDTDIGARVGLRWPQGPFEMMNPFGVPSDFGANRAVHTIPLCRLGDTGA